MERYLLYEDDGEYERYITGMYFGKGVPDIWCGMLFETGSYTKSESNITCLPIKKYNFDTKKS